MALAVELFAGTGGWSDELAEAGFRCVGFDIDDRGYDHELVLQDVQTLDGTALRDAEVIAASPPCTGLSTARADYKHGRPDASDMRLFCEALRVIEEADPTYWVLENVQGAIQFFKPFLGEPRKTRPYYLWGHFPGFLRSSSLPRKSQLCDSGNREAIRSTVEAMRIPTELARPFARSCAEALGVA